MEFTHQQGTCQLRPMAAEDLSGVLSINQQCQPRPWSIADFESSIRSGHQSQVLELKNEAAPPAIVAFVITSTAADEAELLNIAVAIEFQRQGLARKLLSRVSRSFDSSIHTFFLEVRASNSPAMALYDSLDFNKVGIRSNYYPADNGREDAVIMAKHLN